MRLKMILETSPVSRSPSSVRRFFGRGLLLAALACTLGACAAPQVAYKRLDWLASWKLGQYVDLKSAQESRFETEFRQLWDWHRASELAGYGRDLRELAVQTQEPMSAADIRQWASRAGQHSRRVVERASLPACELMATFDDTQRDSMLRRIDANIQEDADEYLGPSIDKVRKDARKRTRKLLVRWIGDLQPGQEAMVEAWAEQRPQRYEQWIAERRRWRDRLAVVLDQRGNPGFCGELKTLLLPAEEGKDQDLVNQDNAQNWFAFLASFSTTLDERQRAHLRDKLLGLASDFEALQKKT